MNKMKKFLEALGTVEELLIKIISITGLLKLLYETITN